MGRIREADRKRDDFVAGDSLPGIDLPGSWDSVLQGRGRARLLELLPAWLRERRWFGGKARTLRGVRVLESIPLPTDREVAWVLLLRVEYEDGGPETYVVPLTFHPDGAEEKAPARSVLARLRCAVPERSGLLVDAMDEAPFARALLRALLAAQSFTGAAGRLDCVPGRLLRRRPKEAGPLPQPTFPKAEQSNSSLIFGDRYFLKVFRRIEEGINPDVEIGTFLTERAHFPHVPPVLGELRWVPQRASSSALGILQACVRNRGDAWRYILDELARCFQAVASAPASEPAPGAPGLIELAGMAPPKGLASVAKACLKAARLIGQRTAELHLALARARDPAFAPEPFTQPYQRSICRAMLASAGEELVRLCGRRRSLGEGAAALATAVLSRESLVRERFLPLRDRRLDAKRIRCHGDYHLGQVLYTGADFLIIDFEGEPARPVAWRRLKRCPMRDVAGMVRSFHYASQAAFFGIVPGVRPADVAALRPWAVAWYRWMAAAFLRSYLDLVVPAGLVPRSPADQAILLDAFVMEKALYEIGYELNHRPEWTAVPLSGALDLLGPGRQR